MDTVSHDTMAMSMSIDEIDEAFSPGGRRHTDSDFEVSIRIAFVELRRRGPRL